MVETYSLPATRVIGPGAQHTAWRLCVLTPGVAKRLELRSSQHEKNAHERARRGPPTRRTVVALPQHVRPSGHHVGLLKTRAMSHVNLISTELASTSCPQRSEWRTAGARCRPGRLRASAEGARPRTERGGRVRGGQTPGTGRGWARARRRPGRLRGPCVDLTGDRCGLVLHQARASRTEAPSQGHGQRARSAHGAPTYRSGREVEVGEGVQF